MITIEEAQEYFDKFLAGLTEEEREWFSTAPEKLWKKTSCQRCLVEMKHDPHFDKANARSYWCNECLSVVMEEARKRNVVPAQAIERARHDELMAQQGLHGDDCGCDYCSPLDSVSRSATFEVAQAALRPEKEPTVAQERPRLTLKVER